MLSVLAGATPANAATATAVSAGYDHTCALLSDGTVKCWGRNEHGQLGDGTRTWRLTAVAVRGLTGATAVSAGPGMSCAVLADATVRCWGANDHGQLGDGTTTSRSTPVAVQGLAGAVAVSAADLSACAVVTDHTVRCWGNNDTGALGNGTRAGSPTPVAVTGLTDATAVSANGGHACALHADGTVSCWGWGAQLGDGGEKADRLSPAPVPNLNDAVAIGSANPYHSCALTARRVAECWGPTLEAAVFPGFADMKAFSFSVDGQQTEHQCALLLDETVRCHVPGAGANLYWGQLGIGKVKATGPVTVPGLTGVTAITTSDFYTCAVLAGGAIKCWGDNSMGQLGDGTTQTGYRPVSVLGIDSPPPPVFMQTSACALVHGGPFHRPAWAEHPRRFGGSCDRIISVRGVHWRHWGDPVARATGTIAVATCRPNCADSPRRRYRATFVAKDIKRCGKRLVYGTITGRYASGSNFGDIPQQGCL